MCRMCVLGQTLLSYQSHGDSESLILKHPVEKKLREKQWELTKSFIYDGGRDRWDQVAIAAL
jgi:hypothetical protein